MKIPLALCAALSLLSCGWSQSLDMDHHPFQIGAINFFGYGGLPLQKVRSTLPLHVGDTLTFANFSQKPLENAVKGVLGKPPTDVNFTCCDSSQRLLVFIGLPGTTYHPIGTRPVPSGKARLDTRALRMYQHELELLGQAVARGAAGEDDSHGYAIYDDPAVKAVNLAMRSYAVVNQSKLRHVLQSSSDPDQRRAAAALLGYAQRSSSQMKALLQAMRDPDEEVRNNAIRALEVLLSASDKQPLAIDLQPFVDLLYSGIWSDRNKASLAVLRLTKNRDPRILNPLRKEAMGPLVEGASWTDDPGHSAPFLVILGRIGGIPEGRLQEMVAHGDRAAILSAAFSARE